MTTNVKGNEGRSYHTCQTHYLRLDVDTSHNGMSVLVGELPEDAVVIRGMVATKTAFDAGSTIDVGTAANPTAFAAAVPVNAAGMPAMGSIATAPESFGVPTGTKVFAAINLSGVVAAGAATILLEYVSPH